MPKQVIFTNPEAPTTILSNMPSAAEGNWPAMSVALFVLSEAIRQGVPLGPEDAAFVSNALRETANGVDPKAAFRIRRKRGGKDTRAAAERAVARVVKVKNLRAHNNLSLEKAIGVVADEEGASSDTVRKAWREYQHCISTADGWAVYDPLAKASRSGG